MPEERDPRVLLAIERTFLAWTRTALALTGFGFVVARLGAFLEEGRGGADAPSALQAAPAESLWVGIGLVVLGMVVQAFALHGVAVSASPQPLFTGLSSRSPTGCDVAHRIPDAALRSPPCGGG